MFRTVRHIKLLFALAIIFFSVSASFSQNYWVRQNSPTTKWFYRCSFPDSVNGWVGGDSGIVIHTSNAGTNWDIQQTGIVAFIYDLFFLNKNQGWGVANGYSYFQSTILKTTNGGLNWTHFFYPDSNIILNTVCFIDSLKGFLGGYQGVVLRTTDAGNTWNRAHVDSGFYYMFHINKIKFYNNLIGFATGGIYDLGGVIWRTIDGGLNWHAYSVSPEPIFNIVIKNSDTAYACGGDFEYGANYVRSTDGGILWEYKPLNIFGIGENLCFRTKSDIWVPLGFSQRWARSTDTGFNWTEILGNDSSAIYDAIFLDSLTGWAFGANGSIQKFNPSALGITNGINNVPTITSLMQNYPNPFNPTTKIEYDLARTDHVRIIIYDVLGKEIKILFDGIVQAGKHTLNFDAAGFSSGLYFYKLVTNNYSQTKKMVILK